MEVYQIHRCSIIVLEKVKVLKFIKVSKKAVYSYTCMHQQLLQSNLKLYYKNYHNIKFKVM